AAALHVIFVTDGPPIGTQARMLVNAGQRSSARIFEHHVGRGTGWTNAMTELRCGEASQLTYVKLQNEHHEADHIAAQHVRLGVDSVFRAAHIDLGARLARNDLKIGMTGSGARAELFGLFLADGRRHVDHHTRTDHRAAHTVSREHYRGILSEHGRGVFNGKVIVHEQAGGTDARLDNRNLLLAKTAEIDTKPELEIYTDDVKCAHGATTGQLDEQALFYLRARGIPRHAARRMLVLAFARDIFQQFDAAESELVDYVNRALERRLPN
ncbi:MAG: Fe-S cluster assembly protein SufD, partial [Gammaproteobacteria bacterium]